MAITVLDPRTALLVIDLQQGLMSTPKAHPIEGILDNAARLAGAFRSAGLPVVLAVNEGGPAPRTDYSRAPQQLPETFTDIVPELGRVAHDIVVSRSAWSAFAGTLLDERLRALRITQVVIVGIATSFGVESTARAAHDLGYNVTVAVDAVTDMSVESHDKSVTRVFPALAETGSVDEVLAALAAATDETGATV